MTIPADIHTHHSPVAGEAIISCTPDTFSPVAGEWYSLGIHPWYIREEMSDAGWNDFADKASHPQVLALGESGLDKLAASPIGLQATLFSRQVRIAEELKKPVVIHLVKAWDVLIGMKRAMRPSVPWIIHGFRGKATMAAELVRHGFHISLGEKYQADVLHHIPSDHLFLETDESRLPISILYQRAAGILGIPAEELQATVRQNILRAFF